MISGIQVIALFTALILSYFSFLHFKRGEFTVREYAGWQFIWLVFAAVSLFPGQFKVISGQFGAIRPLDFFTIIGFIVVLSISFYTYVNVDRLRKKLDQAVRDLALRDVAPKKKKSK